MFTDPAEPDHEVRADATWLTSRWSCLFGAGCPGIVVDRPADGCCTHGAFLADSADLRRVRIAASELTPDIWQQAGAGARGVTTRDELDGEARWRTRRVAGACIFLNAADFPGGSGCALHLLALRTQRHPMQTKPDVCWQLPIRLERHRRTTPDGRTLRVSAVSEFDRAAWGPGGRELSWWCTDSPAAHHASTPLYERYSAELTALLGAPAYAELARLCADMRAGHPPAHPGSPAAGGPPTPTGAGAPAARSRRAGRRRAADSAPTQASNL